MRPVFNIPVVCARCGSRDVQWLGETQVSVFVRCGRCNDVWRLDPVIPGCWVEDRRLREAEAAAGLQR
jgi:hypothetical protein